MKRIVLGVSLTLAAAACGVSNPEPAGPPPQPPSAAPGALHGTPIAAGGGYAIEAVPSGIPSGRSSVSRALCAQHAVVGTASIGALSASHAIRYDASGLHDLGTLGGYVSGARDINASGEIVGTSGTATSTPGASGPGHAFVVRGGAMIDLGGIGGVYSDAFGINDAGLIVGSATIPGVGDVPSHAVLWDSCGIVDLGTLGGTDSFARDINNAGDIVGTSVLADGRVHAAIWHDRMIADLAAGATNDSQATAINEAGTIAGFTRAPDHAVVWRHGTLDDLGTLGGTHSFALGLDDAGDVVGASTVAGDQRFHAFLYSQGAMTDLEQFVDTTHWQLLEAVDVCPDGWIVGNGLYDGMSVGYMLTPLP